MEYSDQVAIFQEELLLRLNRAAALLKLGSWQKAISQCGKVLHRWVCG